MTSNSPTSFFEYWDEAPHDWSKLLQERVAQGETQVVVPVLWGVHESAPGMRDFSKQSKFRIEKVFTLAQGVGLSVKVILGLPAHPQAFPGWVLSETQRELVPKILWDGEPPYFSMVSLPSPRASRVKEGFFSFLEEVSSILGLYLAPGGPITEIDFQLKPLEYSQAISAGLGYTQYLGRRYPEIDIFNKRFQTHYRNLESVANSTGARVIESKRPWVFAYDYRWSRNQVLRDYFAEIFCLSHFKGLKNALKKDSNSEEKSKLQKESGLCIESNWVEVLKEGSLSPFMPEGMFSQSMVNAFQWASFIQENAKAFDINFSTLPVLENDGICNYSTLTVICGKYMSSAASSYVAEQLKRGSRIFFPIALPQYDENLDTHPLYWGGVRKSVRLGGVDWFEIQKENGQIFIPSQSSDVSSPEGIRGWLARFGEFTKDLKNG